MAQRVKHSKIKNTGILFELISRQITVDVMNGDDKSKSVEMLKKFFNEGTELGKENQLYQVLLKENCPWHQKFYSMKPPFILKYDGNVKHCMVDFY